MESISSKVWETTSVGYRMPYTLEQTRWDGKARNAIFESLDREIYRRVKSKGKAFEIWATLIEIHEGSTRVREQKYHLLHAKYDNFKMLEHECCNAMYSRLNVLIEDINALEISTLVEGDINRKILMLFSKPKYNIINSMLQKENLDGMEVSELIGEIHAHEMSVLGML